MGQAVGIDLGTTFSAAARVDDSGRAVIIPNAEGQAITPSVIWFGSDPPTVGEAAKAEQKAGATDVAAYFKRRMGDPNFSIDFNGRTYSPVDLSALVLGKVAADCRAYLRDSVTDVVITVPAYFTNSQREATIEAGRLAGLNVLRIINEPTAAALAYGVHKSDLHESVLVYDLGGGTFDVTLVEITPDEIRVLATDGDHELGGKDWDDRIVQFLALRFREEHGMDPIEEAVSFSELLVRSEDAKRRLSTVASVKIPIDHAGFRATYELTREQFEEQTADLMERTQKLTEQVLADARVRWDQLAGVLPVGGSSQMPMVHRYVQRMSGKPPRTGVPVEQAVALGAAVQAAIDARGLRKDGRRLRIGGEKTIRDVMAHSLGMVAVSPDRSRYLNSILIPKNAPIPATRKLPFKLRTCPGPDNVCEVYITQGESARPRECDFLGKYAISGIAHDKSREVVLEIEYAYDQNGVVNVAAVDPRSGQPLALRRDQVPADMSWVDSAPEDQPWVPEPVVVYLVIDVSGSMSGGPLQEAQQAAIAFRSKCDLSHMSVGLVSFGSSASTELVACQDARRIDRAVQGLGISGSTNMADGIEEAHRHLARAEGRRYLVLLTDGYPDDGSAAASAARSARGDEVEIIAIGTGSADVGFLSGLSSSSEGAVFADAGNLVGTFSTIAQAITEQSGEGRVPFDQMKRR